MNNLRLFSSWLTRSSGHVWFVTTLLSLGLAACASSSGPSGAGAAVRASDGAPAGLERRAVERWERLIAGDTEGAYAFLSPGYRATRPLDRYQAGVQASSLKWTSIKWRSAQCASDESCVASLLLNYTIRMPSAGDTSGFRVLEERWIRMDGTWYHLPER